jgi:Holliday junction resolvasome RuvABC endonuclease subunit
MKWLRFESRLKQFIVSNKIKVVAYELPAGRNINPIIHSSKLICIIEKICAELDLEYVELATGAIKKFATGNGGAGKPLMIEFAEKLWGYEGDDDNQADALHILHFLKSKIN